MTNPGHSAWQEYWRAPTSDRGGCLPAGASVIQEKQVRVWAEFANRLPRGARVLDLATGDGFVVRALLRVRRDLRVRGVDQARGLPPPPRGAKLQGGVSLDALPFRDASFAAITSQFGFEYAELDAAARELARVLVPGGTAQMIVHRADSPIVAHNRARAEAIDWAVSQEDLPGQATRFLHSRLLGAIPLPLSLSEAPERGARIFGPSSAAWEIAEAIRRALAYSVGEPAEATHAVLERIAAQAVSERSRIDTLQAAAARAGTGEHIVAALERTGLVPIDQGALDDGKGASPFATRLTFRKP